MVNEKLPNYVVPDLTDFKVRLFSLGTTEVRAYSILFLAEYAWEKNRAADG